MNDKSGSDSGEMHGQNCDRSEPEGDDESTSDYYSEEYGGDKFHRIRQDYCQERIHGGQCAYQTGPHMADLPFKDTAPIPARFG